MSRDRHRVAVQITGAPEGHAGWRPLEESHRFEEFLDVFILLSMAATCFYVLRLRLLMHQQEKATGAVEAELRFERSTLEQRIQSRTGELRTEVEERRRAERLNRGRSRVLELLATNAPVDEIRMLLVSTIAEQRSTWNCALHRFDHETGILHLTASVGLPDSLVKHLDQLEVEFTDAPEAQAVATGSACVVPELEQSRTPWRELLIANSIRSLWSMPVLTAAGDPLGSLTIYSRLFYAPTERDLETLETGCKMAALVHEHRRIHTELVRHASQDHLTGLMNRRLGESRLEDIIERARAAGGRIAVLWIDLNRFKRINDVHGHSVGDAVLQEVARRLTAHLRSTDLVARMGGDEFMVILENVSHREVAEKIAHSLAHLLRQPFQYGKHEIEMAASVGLSLCPEDGISVDQLEKNADRAMYEAKWNGLPVVAFSPRLGELVHERIEMEAALRVALSEDCFELHYQPQYSVGGELRALEALLRFRHPRLGLVAPSSFIPVAEESGLIIPIGEWVLRTACEHCASWEAEGFRPVPVAVNISPLQFTREDFADTVARILAEAGLAPDLLELELTESLVMGDFNESARQMSRLKRLGTRIAMDDFGTGYSSLSYLHRLPIDVLKIDRSFVEKLTDEDGTRPIVEAVLSMAHKLGLEVVAEGVETVAQLQLLRQAGCDSVQGFLFAPPQPVENLREWLAGPLGPRVKAG